MELNNKLNLKDDDSRYFILGKVLSNNPIDFYGKKIKYITVNDLFEYGEDFSNDILKIFCYSEDLLGKQEIINNLKNNIPDFKEKDFEILEILYIISQSDKEFEKNIFKSMNFLFENNFKWETLDLLSYGIGEFKVFLSCGNYKLDSKQFNELSEILRLIYNLKLLTKDDLNKEDKNEKLLMKIKDESVREEFRKILYERDRREKNTKDKRKREERIYNIFNYINIQLGGLHEKELLQMNLYQFLNLYQGLMYKNKNDLDRAIMGNGLWDSKKYEYKDLYSLILK